MGKKNENWMKLLAFIPFIAPLLILYFLDSASFSLMYPGRTEYIFFVWLSLLEIIIYWEKIQIREKLSLKGGKNSFTLLTLLMPTIYIIIYIFAANFLGIGHILYVSTYSFQPDPVKGQMYFALSLEYIIFAIISALIIISVYNLRGLAGLFAPSLFLGSIGFIFLIDWAFPESSFGPFKALVRPTATMAAIFLDAMGYKTQLIEQPSFYGPITGLIVSDPNKNLSVGFGIAWPCAGVESLFLYTVTLLLFLQTFRMAKKRKLIYFIIGAIVTYLINILRIVTIYIIALNKGDWGTFHSYYGWLYSFLWIATYPLIILMIQTLSNKNRKESTPFNC